MKNPLSKKLDPIIKDLNLSSMFKKLVEPIEPTYGNRSQVAAPDEMVLRSIADTTTSNIMDTKSIFQMLPDLELAEQILISSILSPKDMISVDLQYNVVHGSMESDFSAPLLKVIGEYWDRDYKINEKLDDMLSQILFHRGSFPIAILPEGSIDALINSTNGISKESLHASFGSESYLRSKGLLGKSVKAEASLDTLRGSLESMIGVGAAPSISDLTMTFPDKGFSAAGVDVSQEMLKDTIIVSDNYEWLRVPSLMQRITEQRVSNTLAVNKIGMESRKLSLEAKKQDDYSVQEIRDYENSLYVKKPWKHVPAMVVPTPQQTNSPNHGHPLLLNLPSEAVVPVFVPSDPTKHIGYFVLLDINGNPISNATRTDYYSELSKNLTMRREVTNATVAGTNRQENVFTDITGRHELDMLARTYGRLVEADLLTRLKNGAYGNNVQINAPEEVYRVMLARTFARQKTQLLYIPTELMTYMAFDYNEYGIGTSLIDKTKILSSMRAMLTFANTMAAVKNASGRTNLNIVLDPEDPNPIDTVEKLINSFVNGNSARFPLGASSAKDLVDYLQKAGVGLQVSGNERYPNTSMSVEDKSSQKVLVDTDLQDNLKKQQIQALGLPPEAVDLGMNVEFATSLIQSNLLLAKRAMVWQRKFVAFLRDFVYKFSTNSETIVSQLTELVKSNKGKIPKQVKEMFKEQSGGNSADSDASLIDFAVAYFLDNLELSLPSADMASLENKLNALEAYIKGVDLMLDSFLASAMYSEETEGAIAANIDVYRECVKAYFVKMWAIQNDFMPEMFVMLEKDKDGKSVFDLVETQGEDMTELNTIIADFSIYLDKSKKDRDAKLLKAGVGVDPVEPLDEGGLPNVGDDLDDGLGDAANPDDADGDGLPDTLGVDAEGDDLHFGDLPEDESETDAKPKAGSDSEQSETEAAEDETEDK